MVRDRKGAWNVVEEVSGNISRPREFRTESAAQREGSLMLKDEIIDAYKVFKLLTTHH